MNEQVILGALAEVIKDERDFTQRLVASMRAEIELSVREKLVELRSSVANTPAPPAPDARLVADLVVGDLVRNKEFLAELTGPKGEKGDKGEGPSDEVVQSIVRTVIAARMSEFWDNVRKEISTLMPAPVPGKDGVGIKAITLSGSTLAVELDDRTIDLQIQLPKDGKDGKDASPEQVKAKLLADPAAVELLRGAAGEAPAPEAVAKALAADPAFVAAATGPQGATPAPEAVAKALAADPAFVAAATGPQGEAPAPEAVAKALAADPAFVVATTGAPGSVVKAEDVVLDIAKALLKDAAFLVATKGEPGERGEKGEQGDQGDRGEPGLDRPVFDVYRLQPNDKLPKNAIGSHMGALYQATRITKGDPSQDPNGWHLLVDGVSNVESKFVRDRRLHRVTFNKASGEAHTIELVDHPRYIAEPAHWGTFIEGDYKSIDDGIAVYIDNTWVDFNLRGPQGDKGDKGERGSKGRSGRDGVGIDYITVEKDNEGHHHLLVMLTNGAGHDFVLDLPRVEEIDSPIKRHAGPYNAITVYKRGDLTSANGELYLAQKDGSGPLTDKKLWQKVFSTQAASAPLVPRVQSQSFQAQPRSRDNVEFDLVDAPKQRLRMVVLAKPSEAAENWPVVTLSGAQPIDLALYKQAQTGYAIRAESAFSAYEDADLDAMTALGGLRLLRQSVHKDDVYRVTVDIDIFGPAQATLTVDAVCMSPVVENRVREWASFTYAQDWCNLQAIGFECHGQDFEMLSANIEWQ